LLAALTFIFLLVCVTLKPFGIYSGAVFSVPVLIALLVCLIPTRSADSERHRNQRHRPVDSAQCDGHQWPRGEAAGDVDVLRSTRPGRSPSGTGWPRRSYRR